MDDTLFDILKATARRQGAKTAFYADNTATTYRQFLQRATWLARGLCGLGVRPGDRVAILLPNVTPVPLTVFAAAACGATAVPLNPLLSGAELARILTHAQPRVLVTATQLLTPELEAAAASVKPPVRIILAQAPAGSPHRDFKRVVKSGLLPLRRLPGAKPDDPAVIFYTSGTTGLPKGVMLSHCNILANARSVGQLDLIHSDDVLVGILPLFHAFAFTVSLAYITMVGATTSYLLRFEPRSMWHAVGAHRCTCLIAVPAMLALLSRGGKPPEAATLRLVVAGGDALPRDVQEEFESKFGLRVMEGYGLSEAGPVVAVNCRPDGPRTGSIGPPIPDVAVTIVDDDGREVPAGQVGELCVSSPALMMGYYQDPEQTAAVLQDGWLHTGDLARQDEQGNLAIAGRKKDLIIVAGENVFPAEIERTLLEHPAVANAGVIGVADARRGEIVKAIVVLKEGAQASEKDLIEHCRERLALFKVPSDIEFVAELPVNFLGKVKRQALREAQAPTGEPSSPPLLRQGFGEQADPLSRSGRGGTN